MQEHPSDLEQLNVFSFPPTFITSTLKFVVVVTKCRGNTGLDFYQFGQSASCPSVPERFNLINTSKYEQDSAKLHSALLYMSQSSDFHSPHT